MELLALAQVYAGFVWAGYNLASANFIFDAVTPPKIASMRGIPSFSYRTNPGLTRRRSGRRVASYAPRKVGRTTLGFYYPILPVFLLSGLFRLLVVVILLPRFKEVRVVQPIRTKELLFRIVYFTPLLGGSFEIISSVWKKPGSKKR